MNDILKYIKENSIPYEDLTCQECDGVMKGSRINDDCVDRVCNDCGNFERYYCDKDGYIDDENYPIEDK